MQVKIQNLRSVDQKSIKAFFTLYLEELGLTIKDCKYIQTKSGDSHFIGFPSVKQPNGEYTNLIHFTKDHQGATELHNLIIDEVETVIK